MTKTRRVRRNIAEKISDLACVLRFGSPIMYVTSADRPSASLSIMFSGKWTGLEVHHYVGIDATGQHWSFEEHVYTDDNRDETKIRHENFRKLDP